MIFDIEHFTGSDWAAVISGLVAFGTAIANILAGKAQNKTVENITKTADASIELSKSVSKDVGSSLRSVTKALSTHLNDIGTKTAAMDVRTTAMEVKATAMDSRTTSIDSRTTAMDVKLDDIILKLK
ncbi:hypothetical protein QFZ23_003654 [Arthrobacter globiformis]|uniref:hypothetical protein n=1 Tax=Arthrobacter globiformis TaxID=1665 RepID=UPI00277FE325|nr:hypothetical protein [Arthrobacter globiformis]MDQ1059753.1 hypothetical protein [Arthrobacter globiformis]